MTTKVLENVKIQHVSIDLTSLFPYTEPDDVKNHRTHIVNPPMNLHIYQPGMETQELVDIARMGGLEITALCGYVFVPKHNPEKFDLCEACRLIAENIMKEVGE